MNNDSRNNDSRKQERGFSSSLALTADHIVGDIVLGTVGQLGFHLGKVPGIGTAGAYVRDNVRAPAQSVGIVRPWRSSLSERC